MARNASAIAQQYFDAWNSRDAAGIVRCFAPGGTYEDPTSGGPLQGAAIGAYAERLWAAFPDLSFELGSVAETGDGTVAAEWTMRGTNTGSFNELPPTGARVELPGADFVRTEGGHITSVRGYFDSGTVPRALGLDVIVQPKAIGPFAFGISSRVTAGSQATPGAFSITCLEARSEAEKEEVRERGRAVATEMLRMPGFISLVSVAVGDRMMTISAWETPEAPRQLMAGGAHRDAAGRFFGPELARGGATGVWTPHRLNPRWVRCEKCGKMADSEKAAAACACGADLNAPIAYW